MARRALKKTGLRLYRSELAGAAATERRLFNYAGMAFYSVITVLSCSPIEGLAFGLKPKVYLNADVCRAAHALSDSECVQAYQNARAEFDEKAPKFASRFECERHFHRCMIGDIRGSGRGVDFIPSMLGFRIESGRQRQILPVVEGGEADPLFRPRAVDRVDASVSAARSAEARKAWQALTSPPPAPATARPFQGPSSPDIGDQGATSGGTQSYPVSPSMLQDMRTRERLFGLGRQQ